VSIKPTTYQRLEALAIRHGHSPHTEISALLDWAALQVCREVDRQEQNAEARQEETAARQRALSAATTAQPAGQEERG